MSLPYLIIFKEITLQILDTLTFYSMKSGDCRITTRFSTGLWYFVSGHLEKFIIFDSGSVFFKKLSFPKYFKKLLAFPVFLKGIFTVTIKESHHSTLLMTYAICFKM